MLTAVAGGLYYM